MGSGWVVLAPGCRNETRKYHETGGRAHAILLMTPATVNVSLGTSRHFSSSPASALWWAAPEEVARNPLSWNLPEEAMGPGVKKLRVLSMD